MNNTRILVTGGAGFIGRWVTAQAVAAGATVTVLDNFAVGSRENLAGIEGDYAVEEGSINDLEFLHSAMAKARPEIVIHLAAHHFIPFCNAHPEETLRVNSEGTIAVLRAAQVAGAGTALVASSGVLYPPTEEPLHEDGEIEIADIYGLSKKMTEDIAHLIETTTGMTCPIARLFNTYGPYETNPHLIPHIMESLQRGDEIELGNLHPKRDYIYVEDTARFILALASLGQPGVVANVGTGEEYSVQEVVDHLAAIRGRGITIKVDQERVRATDKMHQKADLSRLMKLTGAAPPRSLTEGLAALLEHEGLAGVHPAPRS